MKFFANIIILLLYSISINVNSLKSFNFNEEQSFDSDPDEMIYKIKNFIDIYSKQLQNKHYKKVNKILLPITNVTNNPIQYVENFDLDGMKQDVENYLDIVKKIVFFKIKTRKKTI